MAIAIDRKRWGRWADWRTSFYSNMTEDELIDCAVCGRPVLGQRQPQLLAAHRIRCDGCWEVEHRLENYLVEGGAAARIFVLNTLSTAATRLARQIAAEAEAEDKTSRGLGNDKVIIDLSSRKPR